MYAKLLFIILLLITFYANAEESVQLITVAPGITLHTTIFKPDSDGPFPLVIMNHGKDLGMPSSQGRERIILFTKEFLKRGYAVIIPMRRGFARSTGEAEIECDLYYTGIKQADDVQLVLDHFTKMPWVDKNRILVAGGSFGGLTAVAFGIRNYPGVRGTISFAGGLKFQSICLWQDQLVAAMYNFGLFSKTPSLWFYGSTDSHFGPDLVKRMFLAYTKNGAPAKLVTEFPYSYKNDSHGMLNWKDGVKFWWPETEKFLISIGLPVEDLKYDPVLAD